MNKRDKAVGVAVIGVTGYGASHVDAIVAVQGMGLCRWVAACDRNPAALASQQTLLDEHRVERYDDLDAMLSAVRGRVRLIGVPVGIPYHAELSIRCMEAGFHVLCEKPPAPTIQEVDAMIEASERTGMTCQIGFQRSWTREFLGMREVIRAGRIGAIKAIRIGGWWKRADTYYARNAWAGRLKHQGRWVLDGTINNPFAHQIQAALHLVSMEDGPTTPVRVKAELYRCRDITGDDTSCVAIETANGATIHSYLTLCAERPDQGPIHFIIEGERGVIETVDGQMPRVTPADGQAFEIEAGPENQRWSPYADTCRYLADGAPPLRCPVAWTRGFTLAINGAFESAGPPDAVDDEFVKTVPFRDSAVRTLAGVDGYIEQGYRSGGMFSEMGAPWARPGRWFEMPADYRRFEPGW